MAADVRVSAVRLLVQMLTHGGTLTSLLPDAQQKLPENERALLQAFCYGMARWSLRLSGLVDQLLSKPLKRKDLDVYLLLQLGIYQLDYMRIPSHAAVNTTVQAAANLGKPWARALVNAVLRNYQRRLSALDENLSLAQQVAHPQWLLTLLQQDWPGQWQQIVDQGNAHAPMSVRVNVGQISLDRYRQRLHEEGIEAFPNRFAPEALELKVPVPVQALPGFDAGEVSVQDTAAQLAAQLLNRASGGRLLDACAAPGGKTAHALEIGDWQHVEVLDIHAKRLQRVRESLTRLSLADRTALHVADAATVEKWWDGTPFDAILLDAPCTGTGVIRRHPDIKMLRRPDDVAALVIEQQRLLNALWPTLAVGGLLLYATCSVLKCENENQITRFCGDHANASLTSISARWGMSRVAGRQILPGMDNMDGFYYAMLAKTG